MTKQQLRQFVLVVVIACQALAGTVASAAPVMGPADMAQCESEMMAASMKDRSEHGGHAMHHLAGADAQSMADASPDHACDNGCCCPGACSSAAAILPEPVLQLDDSAATAFVLMTSTPADLRVADPLRPPIFA